MELPMNEGWVCPKCGRVLAPNTMYCLWCCSGRSATTTSTSTADRKDKLIEPQIYGLFRKGELSDDDVKELKKQIGQIIEYADRKTELTEREGE